MSKELVLNPQEFGLEESKANELIGNLPQIKAERSILEVQFNEVIKLPIDELETSKKARELRLMIQKNRTQGINVWHKTTKDFFLKGGQFVDAIKRKEVVVNERMESDLQEIENYAEIQEKKRIDELNKVRVGEICIYEEFVPIGINLGAISDEEYKKVFNGAKLQYDQRQEEIRLEEERLREVKRLDKLEYDRKLEIAPYTQFLSNNSDLRIMSEDDYLSLLNSLKNAKLDYEKEQEAIKKEAERLAKANAEIEAKAKAERLKKEKEAEKLRLENEAKLKAEQESKAKLEKELQAKKDDELREIEAKKEIERLAKLEAEKLAKAPIKDKLKIWVDNLKLDEAPLDNEVTKDIISKFNSFKSWAAKEIEKI